MSNIFLSSLATIASVFCWTACSNQKLEEIINSEVSGSGIDNIVSAKTSTDENGINIQSLSYKSWIKVKGQTKADFDKTVTVNLTGELPDIAQEHNINSYVESLDPRWMYTTQGYMSKGSRKEGYVTITDSVLVYTVHHYNFDFSYNLKYEVPVYDDGITREVMPYYRYERIVDKGYELKQEDSKVINGIAYACNIYQHALEVTFNGKVYSLHANVTLLHELGPANKPYIVRSEIIEEGTTLFDDHVLASISIRRKWSTGEIDEKSYGIELCEQVTPEYSNPFPVFINNNDSIEYESLEVTEEDKYLLTGLDNYMNVYRYLKKVRINFTVIGPLDVEIYGDEAYYDDGVLYHYFKSSNAVGSIEYGGDEWKLLNSGYDEYEKKRFEYYEMTYTLNVQFGSRIVPKKIRNELCCWPIF